MFTYKTPSHTSFPAKGVFVTRRQRTEREETRYLTRSYVNDGPSVHSPIYLNSLKISSLQEWRKKMAIKNI